METMVNPGRKLQFLPGGIDWADIRDEIPVCPGYYLTTEVVSWAYKSISKEEPLCVHAHWDGEQWEDIYGATYDSDGTSLDGEQSYIIAWAELPMPYERKEEADEQEKR